MTNHCGSCTACCRVFSIPEIEKPAGKWCDHCAIGKGCKVYDTRPKTCVDYECLWLMSQSRDDPRQRLAPELRPDRSKVVIAPSTNPNVMGATTLPGSPDAWKRPAMHALLKTFVDAGLAVSIGPPAARYQTVWKSSGIRQVEMSPPDENGIQWSVESA
jgi:hypothetical protein